MLAVAQSCLDNDPRHRSDISHITVLAASSSEFSFVDSSEPSIQVEGVLSRLECRQGMGGGEYIFAIDWSS